MKRTPTQMNTQTKIKSLSSVIIPDLWHISSRAVRDKDDGDKILGCWHTAHHLLDYAKEITAQRDALLAACKFIHNRLHSAEGIQCRIYSDTLGPDDDDQTVVQYLVKTIAACEKGGAQ